MSRWAWVALQGAAFTAAVALVELWQLVQERRDERAPDTVPAP